MSQYTALVRDMQFVMTELANLEQVLALPGFEETDPGLVDAILDEAGKFAGEVLPPLNRVGDTVGSRWEHGVVSTAPGFKEAYGQFVESGWNGLACEPEFGRHDCKIGEIDRVNVAELQEPALASTFGGPLPVHTTAKGGLSPATTVYRVRLSQCAPALAPTLRLRGTAHLEADGRSLLLAWARQALRVVMWGGDRNGTGGGGCQDPKRPDLTRG